jgi:ribosomal protein S18 acetylase RimI-like enzyme
MDAMQHGSAARSDAAVNPLDIRLRPAQARDEAFLKTVHDAGRAWEFEALKAQGQDDLHATIMAQQYSAQHDVYFNAFTLARYAVIQWCDQPIGRVYADFRDHEIRILDLNVLPAYRGKRIGEIVVRGLCGQAASERKPVSLQVHPLNRARVFYQRLGFRERARQPGPFVEMYWRDPATTPERL